MSDTRRSMRHPKALLVALLGGGLMLAGGYYSLFAYQQENGAPVSLRAGEVAEGLNLPSLTGILQKLGGGGAAFADGGMESALPPARDGWTRRDWQKEDGDVLVAASAGLAADQEWLGKSVVSEFLEVARREMPGVLQTYARGDERIVVMIRRLPVTYSGGGELSLSEREAVTRQMLETGVAPIAVQGVALRGYAVPKPGEPAGFERLRGSIGGQISVEVATNTDRAALVKLLSGLDMVGLNRFADVPDPLVSADKGVQVAPGLTPGEPAPVTADPEVTRGASRAQEPVAEGEKPVVCIRRAGKRDCD